MQNGGLLNGRWTQLKAQSVFVAGAQQLMAMESVGPSKMSREESREGEENRMTAQILIADRDPIIREDCRRYLTAHGYEAAVAADALQCIEQLQSISPAVLVLDPELSCSGGLEVLDWLREQAPLKPVNVVLTNGHSATAVLRKFEPLIAGRLARPTCLSELATFVNELQRYLESSSSNGCSAREPELISSEAPRSRP